MTRPVIQLEFNELTPVLMDRFIDEGHLPNFKKLRDKSLSFITDAGEAPPNLEPWIQWTTIHTSLTFGEHKIFDLGDGHKLKARRIWDVLSEHGKKSWICGSMNAAIQADSFNGRILPDPWSVGIAPYPAKEMDPFISFVRQFVQEYTREKVPVTLKSALDFGRFLMTHGISSPTVTKIAKQLLGERIGGNKWRRATILDRLQWDIFKHYMKKDRPDFATFFLNSTAHFQHYYWRNLKPEAFAIKPTADQQREYENAILYGYQMMDWIVGDALRTWGDSVTFIMCTGLGSQPMLQYEQDGGIQLYKIKDPAKFFEWAGIRQPYRFAPVMAEEFRLYFDTIEDAAEAEALLLRVKTDDGTSVIRTKRTGAEIYAGCNVYSEERAIGSLEGISNTPAQMEDFFYPVDAGLKSGMHHGDGMLWITPAPDQRPAALARRVELTEIGPTILKLCGVENSDWSRTAPMPEISVPSYGAMAA